MAYTPASSNTVTAPFDGTFLSLYSSSLKPEVISKLYSKFGKQFDVLDFLRLAGQEISMTRDELTTFSQGARSRPVKILGEVSSITNGVIAFGLAASEFDTNSDCNLRAGDSLYVPGYHFGKTYPVQFRVTTAPTSGNTDGAATAMEDIDAFTNNIAANQYLHVGATTHGRGTDQPNSKSRGFYSQTFYTGISKESVEFAGGVPAQELYFEIPDKKGGQGLYGMAIADGEFALDEQMSTQMFIGQKNDNSLTETDAWSANSTVKSTKGMWMWAEDNASDHEYIDTFTVKDLDAVDDLFKTTGVLCQSALIGVGHKLYGQIQDAAHDYISQYSGGTDLMTENMSKLGFTAHKWNRRGIDYKLVNFAQLSNHNTFGADAQNFWTYSGLVIPDEQVTVEDRAGGIYNSDGMGGGKVTLPNVAVGYLQNNGEDRKRIIQQVSGVNGMGHIATSTYDKIEVALLSEYALIANEVEKWVRLIKDGTY